MSNVENYSAVFFQECDELLDDLEERLGALAEGDRDPETVHAAFRAVHSIKGGADAFGYLELVTFAHVFEAAMDAIRGGRLIPAPEVCEALVRGRDVLCDLVERAASGNPDPLPAAETMTEELNALSAAGREAAKPAEDPAHEPAHEPAEEPAEPGQPVDPAGQLSYRIRFAPGPEFQTCGHDPLRLVQALGRLGMVRLRVAGEIPPLADLDPAICPLSWDIGLETESDPEAVENFFQIYRTTAEIGITRVEAGAGGEPPPAASGTAAPPLKRLNPPKPPPRHPAWPSLPRHRGPRSRRDPPPGNRPTP